MGADEADRSERWSRFARLLCARRTSCRRRGDLPRSNSGPTSSRRPKRDRSTFGHLARKASGTPSEPNVDHNVFEDSGLFRSGPPGQGTRVPRGDLRPATGTTTARSTDPFWAGWRARSPYEPVGRELVMANSALIRWAGKDARPATRYEVEWRRQGKKWRVWKESTGQAQARFRQERFADRRGTRGRSTRSACAPSSRANPSKAERSLARSDLQRERLGTFARRPPVSRGWPP